MFAKIKQFWSASISRQLILGVALVHAFLMSIFVYDLVGREGDFLLEQSSIQAQGLAKTLAANGTSWILANDTIGMEEIINSQKNFSGLEYAMFINMEGKVLGFTDRKQVNRYINDEISLKLLNSPAELITLFEDSHIIDVAAPILIKERQIGWARVGIDRSDISENLLYAFKSGALYTLLAISIGTIFAWFMGRSLTSSLRQLSEAANSASKGERKYIGGVTRYDELGLLTEDFNKMLGIINNREDDLNEHISLLDALLNSVQDGIYYKDLDGRYMGCNSTCAKFLNVTELTIVGKTDYDIYPEKVADMYRRSDLEVLKSGVYQHAEGYFESADGEKVLLDVVTSPFYSAAGDIIGLIGVARDISSVREQEEQLRSSRKMDALGKLTGGVAHDYNNILGIILGYSQMLNEKLEGSPELQEYCRHMSSAGQRGATLTSKLLKFSSVSPALAKFVNISDSIDHLNYMLVKTLTPSINVELNLEPGLWSCVLDSDDLDNSVLNICINAMHAMDGKGQLAICTSNVNLSIRQASELSLEEGEYILLSIADTGVGMKKDVVSKIFDPFFTTKGELGTGLGLSQVYGFIKRSEGAVKVESEYGVGSTFNLYFKRGTETVARGLHKSAAADEIHPSASCANATILIVDDELALALVVEELLAGSGFNTIVASTPEDAVKLLNEQKVDVLFTDIIMPNMDGYELAAKAGKIQPSIKVLYTSGYSGTDSTDIKVGKDVHLQKPVNFGDLITKINAMLANDL